MNSVLTIHVLELGLDAFFLLDSFLTIEAIPLSKNFRLRETRPSGFVLFFDEALTTSYF